MLSYIQVTLILVLSITLFKCLVYRRHSKTNFSFCHTSLYPYGSFSQETRTEMVFYLKELMGKLTYLDRSLDTDRILQDWFMRTNYPVLQKVDMDVQYQSTIDIIKETIYPIQSDHKIIKSLVEEMQTKIPKSLVCNDYIQIRELLNMLRQIK